MKHRFPLAATAALILGFSSLAQASTSILFESWPGGNYCWYGCGGNGLRDTGYGPDTPTLVGQQFHSSDSAFLAQAVVGISSDFSSLSEELSFTLTLARDDGGKPGQALESVNYTGQPLWAHDPITINFSGNTLIEANTKYWIVASPLGPDNPVWWMPTDWVYPGAVYAIKHDYPDPGYGNDWQIYSGAAYSLRVVGSDIAGVVPVPGAIWLLGPGLVGLGALSRRNRR